MFSTDKYVNFAIFAKRLASKYGVTLKIDWENNVLDFEGYISDEALDTMIGEIVDLARLYDVEEIF